MFGNKYKQLYQESMLQMQGLVDKINSGYFNPVKIQSLNKIAYTTMLQSKDLMMCANRYVWEGIPTNITSQQIEALLYQYGSLCMFENDEGEIIFSRYTMIGQLNPYGLMDKIQPIDFAGKAYDRVRSVIHSSSQKPLAPQSTGAWSGITPVRLLRYLARLYAAPQPVDALIELLGISGFATTPYRRRSGGQQQA